MNEWDYIAWTCFHIPRFSKGSKKLEEFHPIRVAEAQVSYTRTLSSLSSARKKAKLRKEVTDEEFDEMWDKFNRGELKYTGEQN